MSISQNFPNTRPSLNLNFARSRKLDSRITFTRGSTATYVDDAGLIRTAGINEARFDYDPITGESLGLLIEGSRSNILQYSQALATSPWNTIVNTGVGGAGGTGNFTATNNVTTSPDGTSNASQINSISWTSGDSVYQDVSVSGTSTYALSIFVKGGTCNGITLAAFFTGNSTQGFSFGFNPLTGTITGTSGGSNHTVVSYPNGWYRIYFTVTGTNALNTTLRYQLYTNTTGITYLWGAQLDVGAFPTSYIPTVASTVTRSADNASITGTNFTDWYNSTEYTLFSSARTFQTNSFPAIVSINDGTFNNVSSLYFDSSVPRGAAYWRNSGTQYGFTGATLSSISNTNTKMALAVKTNDWAFAQNGSSQSKSSGNGVVPTGVTRLSIGNGDTLLNGTISQILYYPVRLSNSELQNLTK